MKNKCKVCGKNCEKEYCFRHSKKSSGFAKKLDNSNGKKSTKVGQISEMQQFFLQLWKNKPHYSEISGKYLGNEPKTTYFHHILPKNKYPELAFDEENIILLTFEEHQMVEMDMYKYEEVNRRREQLIKKYEFCKKGV
jgi:hypothetical protein